MPYFVDRCPILVDPNFQNGNSTWSYRHDCVPRCSVSVQKDGIEFMGNTFQESMAANCIFFSSGVAALFMLSLHMASCIIMSLIGGVAPFERIYIYRYVIMFFVNIDFNIYIYSMCLGRCSVNQVERC